MKKGRNALLALVAIFAMFAMAVPAMAEPSDHELPAETDFFWDVFAQMSTPDDTATCIIALNAYIAAHPDEFGGPGADVSQVQAEMSQMCTQVAQMRTEMQTSMTSEGVETSLFDDANTNWHAIDGLYFQKSENGAPMGRISFSEAIDFMSYRFFNFMNNFGNMIQFNDGYISLNASMVPDMINYGTTFTMYGLDFSEVPDIYVSNGSNMRKAIEGTDVSGIVWDPVARTLSFTPGHFSSFRAVEKGSRVKTMKITKVDPRKVKYRANKSTFRINVKGKNLYKKGSSTECTLGFSQATKVSAARNGKRVKCTFTMSEFSTLGYYPLAISIAGQGEVTKTNAVRMR